MHFKLSLNNRSEVVLFICDILFFLIYGILILFKCTATSLGTSFTHWYASTCWRRHHIAFKVSPPRALFPPREYAYYKHSKEFVRQAFVRTQQRGNEATM